MRRRGVVDVLLSAAFIVLVASCSGGREGRSEATAVPFTSPAPTAATVIPSSSIASTSTVATTSTPTSTTPAPTTTTTPAPPRLDDLEAEVAAAYDEIYEGYWACLRAPLECDTSWLVEGSGSAEAMQNTMQALADRARYVGDDPVGYYVIESIEFDDTLTEATVTSCWSMTAVLYTTPVDPNRPAGSDNPPTVVNDIPGSILMFEGLRRQGSGWALYTARADNELAEENQCAGRGE